MKERSRVVRKCRERERSAKARCREIKYSRGRREIREDYGREIESSSGPGERPPGSGATSRGHTGKQMERRRVKHETGVCDERLEKLMVPKRARRGERVVPAHREGKLQIMRLGK